MLTMNKENKQVMELFQDGNFVKICAPMVRYSKLQFRNLVKRYDCDLCFTPMILADSFCMSEKARNNEFTTNLDDTPVIIQFASNTVDDFTMAAVSASPFCSGVDLNCGCPQRWAKQQGLGCVMLEKPQKIFDITRECRNKILKPFTVSVKTRILNDLRRTVEICRQIEKAGASFLTVHARTADHSTGDINEEALKLIKENIDIPLVANGGIRSLSDCYQLRDSVGCDGVMVANAILQNPAIFSGINETPLDCVQHWVDICYNTTISRSEYRFLSETNRTSVIPERPPNLTFQCFHHHLVFMMEKILPKRKRRIFNNFKKFQEVFEFLKKEFNIVPSLFGIEDYEKVIPLSLAYDVADNSHFGSDAKLLDEKCEHLAYNSSWSNGKYFVSKTADEKCTDKDCDWSDMFLEND
ncbi:hypothetical protein HHI36_000020 [Cryptolaemus montrouzieri]|uniref:DUS-like FMN-binding domain-containing protein n=1 Tax=Cryptolaemus montrouzieri TaxID=559131 RepID=A0ABD2P442_9CUCU